LTGTIRTNDWCARSTANDARLTKSCEIVVIGERLCWQLVPMCCPCVPHGVCDVVSAKTKRLACLCDESGRMSPLVCLHAHFPFLLLSLCWFPLFSSFLVVSACKFLLFVLMSVLCSIDTRRANGQCDPVRVLSSSHDHLRLRQPLIVFWYAVNEKPPRKSLLVCLCCQ
jgi:hypothetical protein